MEVSKNNCKSLDSVSAADEVLDESKEENPLKAGVAQEEAGNFNEQDPAVIEASSADERPGLIAASLVTRLMTTPPPRRTTTRKKIIRTTKIRPGQEV